MAATRKKKGAPGWVKGCAPPNPEGRPRLTMDRRELRDLCRLHSTKCLDVLVEVMSAQAERAGDRVRAAVAILDRAYGVPADETIVNRDDALTGLSDAEIERMALDEARQELERRAQQAGVTIPEEN